MWYPAVLLAYGNRSPSSVVAEIQSGLRALVKSLCQVEAIVDSKGRPMVDSEGRPRVKTPNPRIELPYTYLIAWYVMHCSSLMTTVPSSEGFVPFVQKLENSSWSHYYMFFVRKSILKIHSEHFELSARSLLP